MQVIIMAEFNYTKLMARVNDFLLKNKMYSMQYSTCFIPEANVSRANPMGLKVQYSVMISYTKGV